MLSTALDFSRDAHAVAETESPPRERVKAIASKLADLQRSVAKDKLHRREALETRIKSMEERVFRLEERVSVQLRSFREGLAAASEDAQRDRLALQDLQGRVAQDLTQLQQSIAEGTVSLRKVTADAHNELREQVAALSESVAKERIARQQTLDRVADAYGPELKRLGEQMAQEARLRTAAEARENALIRQVEELKLSLQSERKVREELETTLVGMIEDLHAKFARELERHRREREATETQILHVLEETCMRVQAECLDD